MPITDNIYKQIFTSGETVAITAKGKYRLKTGTYTTITCTTNDGVVIDIEPSTVFTSAMTIAGDNVTLLPAPCVDFQGLLTMSGDSGGVICDNGVTLYSVLLSGNKCAFDGGGMATVISNSDNGVYGINITGNDCVAHDFSVSSTGTGAASSVRDFGTRTIIYNVRKFGGTSGTSGYISDGTNSKHLQSNWSGPGNFYNINGNRNIHYGINNYTSSLFERNMYWISGDDHIINSCIMRSLSRESGVNNSICAGNRSHNALTSGGDDIVSNNEEGAI